MTENTQPMGIQRIAALLMGDNGFNPLVLTFGAALYNEAEAKAAKEGRTIADSDLPTILMPAKNLRAALDRSTPPEDLAKLADDENELVRRAVAENSSTPPETLAKLADSKDAQTRFNVAMNLSTPPEVLAKLADDENELVRRIASQGLESAVTPSAMADGPIVDAAQEAGHDAVRETPAQANVDNEVAAPSGTETVRMTSDESSETRKSDLDRSTAPEDLAKLADGEDELVRRTASQNDPRSIPRPPKTGRSRKRPCRKQGGRKQERRENPLNGPKERKLNQYVLNDISGLVAVVRPGQEIPKGSRVIEQPARKDKPQIAAFYDATLLPAGSTVVARWGYPPAELDPQLVGRAGRLAKLAGYGDQARSTLFDQLRRSANPAAALEALILELGGPDALTAEPGTLTTTATRDAMPAAILRAVNAGNEKLIELAENLPARLTPEQRLVDALADLPGMVEGLTEDGNGCILRVRGLRFEDKAVICEKFRDAGGRHVDVQNTRIEKNGRSVKAYIVSARFNVSAVEIAAARTGRTPEISYHLAEDGSVHAEYGVDLYGTRVTTQRIPCEPSWASVEALIKELERRGDADTKALLKKLAIEFEKPAQVLTASVGPVRTIEAAREAIGRIRAEDILSDGYAEIVAKAPREIRTSDGRRIPVEYRGEGDDDDDGRFRMTRAVLAEFSFHPTDLRPALLPANIVVGEDEIPTRVRRVRFETKKNSSRLRVVVEEVEVSELTARHDAYLEGKDPKKVLLTEVRENFVAEATRSMTTALLDPPKSLAEARNPKELDKRLSWRVYHKHLDPYTVEGGDLVHLVEVLAARAGNEAWSRWCRDNVKAFRDDARERRKNRKDPATNFFDAIRAASHAKAFLIAAGVGLLGDRLGRDVTTEEFVETAREARVTEEHLYLGVDRGRALARHSKHNN